MAPARLIAAAGRHDLHEGWKFCATPAGECPDPSSLAGKNCDWRSAQVPGTVAAALRTAGLWSLDAPGRRFDSEDWWYQTTFDAPTGTDSGRATLGFDGLATLCDVWLNGDLVLSSENMFLAHELPLPRLRPLGNELCLRFRALDAALKQKRPRPKWRAPMIENQQLRWFRTTLLGRTPGWSPPAQAVGPWKGVWIDNGMAPSIRLDTLQTSLRDGVGSIALEGRSVGGLDQHSLLLELRRGDRTCASTSVRADADGILCAQLSVKSPELWWPHTHGVPALYDLVLRKEGAGNKSNDLPLGRLGFRHVEVSQGNGNAFAVSVNGVKTFCRGACWTPLDVVSLAASPAACREALEQVRDAGFNMLRLSGALIYEDECFLDLCDEFGILIWQDFMFANMDYPADDPQFAKSVALETRQQARRWSRHACIAVICGNSEVSQQAAMWGTARQLWQPALFERTLAAVAAACCPHAAYWPSSASGGSFPHQVDAGTTSYYGVGAYLRPLDDLRRSGLKFATECLGFANVPDAQTLSLIPGGGSVRVTHPAWKVRSPRDLGAGWDFDDVRDHYLQELFGVDPMALRYSDHARYLELSRRVPAEAMAAAFTEWRRHESACGGALVWFLRDLWPGAGWGVIDSTGRPKSAYHVLRRLLQPVWLGITDEGLNGIALHLGNESAANLEGELEVLLYRSGRHLISRAARNQPLPARSTVCLPAAELLDEFRDLCFAYRFGSLECDLVIARWRAAQSGEVSSTCYLPRSSLHSTPDAGTVLHARARAVQPGTYSLTIRANAFARSVYVDVDGYESSDQYFWLAPDEEKEIFLQAAGAPRPLFGVVTALNTGSPARIELVA